MKYKINCIDRRIDLLEVFPEFWNVVKCMSATIIIYLKEIIEMTQK